MLCILGVAIVANLLATIADTVEINKTNTHPYQEVLLPLNIFGFAQTALIFVMAYLVFSIVKKVIQKKKWDTQYYTSVKQIGWLSVLALLLNAISIIVREQYALKHDPLTQIFARPGIFTEIIAQAIFSSPIAWFLICSIFLVADVLQYTSDAKNENESFI